MAKKIIRLSESRLRTLIEGYVRKAILEAVEGVDDYSKFGEFGPYIKMAADFIWHKDNADFNAAKNIRNRVLVTVLQESLLKQLDNGAFEPRKLKREKVKEVLLSFRRSLRNVGSECTESSVTTFDYV